MVNVFGQSKHPRRWELAPPSASRHVCYLLGDSRLIPVPCPDPVRQLDMEDGDIIDVIVSKSAAEQVREQLPRTSKTEFSLKLGLVSARAMHIAEQFVRSCKTERGHEPPDLHFMSMGQIENLKKSIVDLEIRGLDRQAMQDLVGMHLEEHAQARNRHMKIEAMKIEAHEDLAARRRRLDGYVQDAVLIAAGRYWTEWVHVRPILLASIPRLGAASPLARLPVDLVQLIARMAYRPRISPAISVGDGGKMESACNQAVVWRCIRRVADAWVPQVPLVNASLAGKGIQYFEIVLKDVWWNTRVKVGRCFHPI